MSRSPTAEQASILQAALGDASVAPAAWRDWLAGGGDIEALDDASNRLLGLVYRNLRTATGANGLDPRLAGIYRHNWSANQLRLHEALPLLRRLAGEGEPAMLFKGAALLHLLPGGHGIRPMGDVDVLVRPHQVDTAVDALNDAGFLGPGDARLALLRRHGHAAHFTLRGLTTVDLHWHSLHGPVDDSALFADASTMELAGTPVLLPRPEDTVVHVCAHAMSVQPMDRHRVRWLADLALLVGAHAELDWGVVIARAREGQVAPAVADALRTARNAVELPVPEWVLSELTDTPLRERLLHRVVVRDGPGVLPAYTHMWAMSWRRARSRGERPTLRGFLDCVAVRWKVPGPAHLPRHLADRARSAILPP